MPPRKRRATTRPVAQHHTVVSSGECPSVADQCLGPIEVSRELRNDFQWTSMTQGPGLLQWTGKLWDFGVRG